MMIVSFQKQRVGIGFVKMFIGWHVVQVVLSVVGFVLVIAGVLHPFFEFREMDGRMGYFFGLFATNTWTDGFLRPAGFYDEPGALAFWGFMALLMNKLFLDNKRIEKILSFGLIVTFSIAFFIQIVMYVALFYKSQRKKAITVIVSLFIIIKLVGMISPAFEQAIFGRFKYNTKSGTFAGDNRSHLAEFCTTLWKESPIIGKGTTGIIEEGTKRQMFVGANPMMPFASDGVLGVFFSWLPLMYIFFALGARDPRYRYASIIIFTSFLQRPYTETQILYPIVMYTIALHGYYATRKGVTLT